MNMSTKHFKRGCQASGFQLIELSSEPVKAMITNKRARISTIQATCEDRTRGVKLVDKAESVIMTVQL